MEQNQYWVALTVCRCGPVTSTPPRTKAALTYPW